MKNAVETQFHRTRRPVKFGKNNSVKSNQDTCRNDDLRRESGAEFYWTHLSGRASDGYRRHRWPSPTFDIFFSNFEAIKVTAGLRTGRGPTPHCFLIGRASPYGRRPFSFPSILEGNSIFVPGTPPE